MEYTLRKLDAKDLFIVTTIISRLGVKEIKNCFKGEETLELIKKLGNSKENADASLNAIGISVIIDVAGVVLENMEKCQDKIFQLLSNHLLKFHFYIFLLLMIVSLDYIQHQWLYIHFLYKSQMNLL